MYVCQTHIHIHVHTYLQQWAPCSNILGMYRYVYMSHAHSYTCTYTSSTMGPMQQHSEVCKDMYICHAHIHIHIHTHLQQWAPCSKILRCVQICIYVTRTFIYARKHTYKHTHIRIHVYVCESSMYVSVCIYMYMGPLQQDSEVCTDMYICHTHIHIHVHTHLQPCASCSKILGMYRYMHVHIHVHTHLEPWASCSTILRYV